MTITLADNGGTCLLNGGTPASVTVVGVTNPVAGVYPAASFTIATSRDVTAANLTAITIAAPAATAVTGVSFTGSPQKPATTASWTAAFTTSTGGALAAGGTITVTFNSAFSVPGVPVITLSGGFVGCTATGAGAANVATITLAGGGCSLGGGTGASVTIAGISNPAAASYAATTFSVATSSDTTAASPSAAVVIAQTAVTGVTFAGALMAQSVTTTWTINLTTSSSGALAAGSTMTATFHPSFSIVAGPAITLNGAFANCSATGSTAGSVVTVTLANSGGTCALTASTPAAFTIASVTNPIAGTYPAGTFGIATSADASVVAPAAQTITATTPTAVTYVGATSAPSTLTTWTIGFTTSSAGALVAGNTITVLFHPAFSIVPTPAITLGAGLAGCTATGSTTGTTVTVTLAGGGCSLAAITPATLSIAGVTNPAAGTYPAANFGVSTTRDSTAALPAAVVIASTAVTGVTFAGATQAPGVTTTWTIGLTTSAVGGLSAGNTITVTFNNNFTVTSATPAIGLSAAFVGCTATGARAVNVVTITLAGGGCALSASTPASLTIAGITNPTSGSYPAAGFSVATSRDSTSVSPGAAIAIATAAVTAVAIAPVSVAAGAVGAWTIGLTTSAAGALAAGDTIAVTFHPAFAIVASPPVVLASGFTQCAASASTAGSVVTITLANSGGTCAVTSVTPITLTLNGITNPGAGVYPAATFSAATSQDAALVAPGSAVTITALVTNVSFAGTPQTAGNVATWAIGFRTSSAGVLAAGNTVSVLFNSNFSIPATPTVALTSGFSGCSATGALAGSLVIVTLADSGGTCTLGTNTTASLTIAGMTNPAAASYAAGGFTVATTKDPTPTASPAAVVIAAGSVNPAVTNVSFAGAPQTEAVAGVWTVSFATGTTGALAAGGTITATFNPGFTIPAPSTTLSVTPGSGFASCSATATNAGAVVTITLANTGGTCALPASTSASLSISGVLNPAAGTLAASTFTVATSAEITAAQATAAVVISAAGGAPPAPTPSSGGGGGGGGGAALVPSSTVSDGSLTVTIGARETLNTAGGVSGGEVTASIPFGPSVTVKVAPGAIPVRTSIDVALITDLVSLMLQAPPPSGSVVVLGLYGKAVTATGAPFTSDFALPFDLEYLFPKESIPLGATPADLSVAVWDGNAWVAVPSTVTLNADGSMSIRSTARHFSVYGVLRSGVTSSPRPLVAAAGGSGAITSGSVPRAGGFGLIVFGGTNAQLLSASGCPAGTAAFWASDAAGNFTTYVPGAQVAVVNEAWNARFPSGLPANTPLIGRCQ